MNRNNAVVAGVIGLVALLVIVIAVLAMRSPDSTTPVVVTPPSSTNTNTNPPSAPSKNPGVPVAVTNATASPTDTTAILKGTVTPNGAFTNYWYEYGPSVSLGRETSKQYIGSGYTATSAPGYVTGLIKDTNYYYRVVAENQFGRVRGDTYSFQTTHGNPPPVGSIPTVRTNNATSIARTTVMLNGEVTPNKSQTVYWFEYGMTPNLGSTSGFFSVGDGSARVPAKLDLSGLDPLITYYFRLNAQNQFGTVQGDILNFKTLGPATLLAPDVTTSEAATSIRSTTATIHGVVRPNGSATMYWFEYGTETALGTTLPNTTSKKSISSGTSTASVKADLTRLASKTTYYYQLVAENSVGTTRGDRMSFTTK